jgi:hypothetical protein
MSSVVRTAVLLSAGSSSVVLAQSGCPRKLTRKDGWRLQRIPTDAGATRSGSEPQRERRPRPCGAAVRADAISRKLRGSLPRLCGEPCGRILVRRRPRSHAERSSLHGPARMRAGSAGANVPSREGDLRVIDRDIGPSNAPARTSQRTSAYGGRNRCNPAAGGGCQAGPFELLTCPGVTAATSDR